MNFKIAIITLCILWVGFTSGCADLPTSPPSIHKILFLGNSLTAHGPSPAIGWSGNWGMAASDANKDYVHQLAARLGGVEHTEVDLYPFETNFRTYNLESIDGYLLLQPDLIVLQIGDNASDALGFVQYYKTLVNRLGTRGSPLIVCTSTWWPYPALNQEIKNTCSAPNLRFVDISHLYADPTNIASSERPFSDAGVAMHPGDKGMTAIADALYRAIR